MSNTYLTGNPLGSTSPKDLYDNASNFDEAMNSPSPSFIDRFQKRRETWAGMEEAFSAFLLASGYEFIGDYDLDGPLTITRPNQIFSKDGDYWRSGPELDLPYTTVNNWVIDQPKFVSVGDAALRQALGDTSDPLNGAAIIGRGVQVVDTVAALRLLSKNSASKFASTRGYTVPADGGHGMYQLDPADITSADNGGTVIVAADGGRWKLVHDGRISIKQFGARGNGSTNDAAAFQAAVDYAASIPSNTPVFYLPPADYKIGTKITIVQPVEFIADANITNGARILLDAAFNDTAFELSNAGVFRNLCFVGTYNASHTSERMFRVLGTNNCVWDGCQFFNLARGIAWSGSTESFFNTMRNCRFENTRFNFLEIDNNSLGGVDMIMSDCRFLGSMGQYCWLFQNGLGSILASNIQISVTGSAPTVQLVYFGLPAQFYGGAQFVNCVFENNAGSTVTAVAIIGSLGLPWREMHFTSCFLTGGGGGSLDLNFTNGVKFTDCTLSGGSGDGIIRFAPGSSQLGLRFIGCSHETLVTPNVYYCAGNSTIDMDIVAPRWIGAVPFINFPLVSASQLRLTVDGHVGTHPTPIILLDYKNTPKDINAFGDNYGPLQRQTYVGSLDGSGNLTLAHGIANGNIRVAQVDGWYRGGSAQAIPLAIGFMDGTNVTFSGGTAGAKYRVSILYNVTADTNW